MNFQNIPRDDKTIKRAILPKLGALSFFDYSAIEPRLFAYYAAKMGHPNLAEKISNGYDPYTAIASTVLGREDITKDERQVWKRVFLGILYGAGARRIRETWIYETGDTITMAHARKIIDTFNESLPEYGELRGMIERVSARRGYVYGIDGRYLHPEPYGEYKMLNKLIQGGAAGIMKQAIVRVHEYLGDNMLRPRTQSHIISIVHDDLWIDGPKDEVIDLHILVPQLMVHEEVNSVVPVEVEHEVSTTNAADKVPYDEWRASG